MSSQGASSPPEPLEEGYLGRVRRLAGRLSSREAGPSDARAALGTVADLLPVDADAPTSAPNKPQRSAKAAVKRAVGWYGRYLAEQVNDLGFAILRAGEALADRIADGEKTTSAMETRLSALEHEVRRLKKQLGNGADGED